MKYKIGDKVLVNVNGTHKVGTITKVFNKAANIKFDDESRCVRFKDIKEA